MLNVFISESDHQRLLSEEERKPMGNRSLLYKLLKSPHVKVLSPQLSAADFVKNAESVLLHPSSLYFLDVSVTEAERIRQSYGVCCFSTAAPDITSLIDTNDEHTTGEHEPLGQGWNTVLQSLRGIPSNALLLTDRYLFSTLSARVGNGIANIHAILDVLLPQRFLSEYHVTVVFDEKSIHSTYSFADIATRLNRIKQSLHRDYPIMMEVLGISPDCPIYNKLHNRRIVSNYFIVKLEHKLAAFNGNIATTQQTITPQVLFTEDSLNRHSTPPLKSIDQITATLRDFSAWTLRIPEHCLYHYAINGRVLEKCSGIKNRIIQ